jgi:hypothetical protein
MDGGICRQVGRVLMVVAAWAALATRASAQCELVELSGDVPDDGFGFAVSVSAERALIRAKFSGGPGGAARIYERSGACWSWVAELVADDHAPGTGFANALAIDSDRVVVGAKWDYTHEVMTGSAYVFEYGEGDWSQVAKLIADDGAEGDFFGASVAISGDYAVVGAIYDGPGSVYVFERQFDGEWVQAQKLTASDGEAFDQFGNSVAVSGNVIVVGARDDDDQGWASGSAYVFERSARGHWSQVAKLLASDGRFLAGFGYSVSVSGTFALIGAYGADGPGGWTGAGYVFERAGDGMWVEVEKLLAADGEDSDIFGCAVGLDGDVALIGARGDSDHATAAGSAYVFVRGQGATWSEVAKLVGDEGEAWDHFGNSVAVSGNIGVVGMWPNDPNNPPKPGKAYIYAVGPDEDEDGIMDACECPGDLNKDWIVDHSDLGLLLADWRCTGGDCPGDADADGDTDHSDLGLLLANWGEVCP